MARLGLAASALAGALLLTSAVACGTDASDTPQGPGPGGADAGGGADASSDAPTSDGRSPSPADGGDGAVAAACAKSCHVTVTGDDGAPGTAASPFRTIGRCTSALAAAGGGECVVHAGTYRETVAVGSNATVHAAASETVTVRGTDEVPGTLPWAKTGAHLWRAPIDLDTGASRLVRDDVQIFVDGAPLVPARWPNVASFQEQLDSVKGQSLTAAGTTMDDGIHGHLVDPSIPAAALVGAVVHVRGGLAWGAHTGLVSSSGGGSLDYVADNGTNGAIMSELRATPGNRYHLVGALALLDAESEFFYDHAARALYLWLADGDSPSAHRIEAKMREWAFDLGEATGAKVEGFSIFAASVAMAEKSAGNTLAGLDVAYASHYVRNLNGPFSGYWNQTGVRLWGTGHTLADSVIRYSAGNGVSLVGTGHTVKNSVIEFTDYAGVYNSSIFITAGPGGYTAGHTLFKNTIRTTGRDAIVYVHGQGIANDQWATAEFLDSRIAFNDISDYGRLAADLGGIYFCCNVDGTKRSGSTVVSRSSIDHNRVHDGPGAGIYFDNQTHGFVVTHNVLFGNQTGGVQLNGFSPAGKPGSSYDFTINNNTFFRGQEYSIKVLSQSAGGLSNTFVSNNIFVTQPGVRTGCAGGICNGKGDFGAAGGSNFYGDPGFVNSTVSPYDFRLYQPQSNACSKTAAAIWTDTSPSYDTCPNGVACASPVPPSYGAFNTGGFEFSFGASP